MATKIHIFLSHGTLILFVVRAWGQDTLPWPIKKRKLYWKMVGQIFVLKLNWHLCCRPQPNSWLKNCQVERIYGTKFVCRCEWAWELRSQIMKVHPSQRLLARSFFSGFSLTTGFLNFSDHSQVFIPIFCISHICSLTMFFSWAVFKACCKSNSPQVHVELLNLPRLSGC